MWRFLHQLPLELQEIKKRHNTIRRNASTERDGGQIFRGIRSLRKDIKVITKQLLSKKMLFELQITNVLNNLLLFNVRLSELLLSCHLSLRIHNVREIRYQNYLAPTISSSKCKPFSLRTTTRPQTRTSWSQLYEYSISILCLLIINFGIQNFCPSDLKDTSFSLIKTKIDVWQPKLTQKRPAQMIT